MIRRTTAALFETAPYSSVSAAPTTAQMLAQNVTVRKRRRKPPAAKYALKPLSQTAKVPWAAALRVQYKELASASREGHTAVELMQAGLAPNTTQNYDSKLAKFIKFCAEANMTPMPAEVNTVLQYLGHLAEEGTVHVDSVQPYLSCINTAHIAVGLNPPALGPAVEQVRKGWRQRLVHLGDEKDKRLPLPPQVMSKVLALAVQLVDSGKFRHDAASLFQLRDAVAVLVTYMFFGRSDTGHAAEVVDGVPDIQVYGTELIFYERKFKGKAAGSKKRTLRFPLSAPLLRVISAFLEAAPATAGSVWRLPQDGKKWNATVIDDMLQRLLSALKVSAPEGYSYSSHSLRSGAASAAYAVGVDIIRICYGGGWAQGSQAVFAYIDLSWQPSVDAEFFFGHLRHVAVQLLGNH